MNNRDLDEGKNQNGRILVDYDRIVFTSVKLEDTGMISCIASNEIDMVGSAGEMIIYRDGSWSKWSSWESCSASCGEGIKTRDRICVGAANGGENCPQGAVEEEAPCNDVPCPMDGRLTQWSEWADCSQSCGRGHQFRQRECRPPAYGGQPCLEDLLEEVPCNNGPCDVDGNWSKWTEWESCDKTCGGGLKIRSRSCDSPAPTGLGYPCTGAGVESKSCNEESCPVDGNWGEWLSWTICSKVSHTPTQIFEKLTWKHN